VPLHPQAQKFLEMMAEAGGPPLSEMTVEQARAMPALLGELVGKGPECMSVRDIEIPGPAGAIPARVYEPVADPPGTVVYYHGGGWVIGGIETWDCVLRMLANESGARVVSVDYRLAPEHPFPAAVEDAYAAAKWVSEELAGGKPLAVAGDSAGGNLSAVTTLKARDGGGPDIALQVLIYPAVDTDLTREHYAQYEGHNYFLNTPDMVWFWNHYSPNEADRSHPDAAPLRAESLAGLPPAYVIIAEYDPLKAEGLEYAARLEEEGVPVTVATYDDQMHAFFTMPNILDAGNASIAAAGAAIKDAFAVKAS
jgi:acetyl esterase